MNELIRKQSHEINDLEYLIDEARSFSIESINVYVLALRIILTTQLMSCPVSYM